MKTPVSWVGGKTHLASHIVALFPPHDHYVHVLCGGMAVLFAKGKSRLETVNDRDQDLVNFWLVCRDDMEALVAKLDYTPYSRWLFAHWKEAEPVADPVERAARWFYVHSASFSAVYHGGWSYQKRRGTTGVPPAEQFRVRVARLRYARDRLACVQIECADFRDMMARYSDSEENLLYLDPPYVGREEHYRERFTPEDHLDLASMANEAKARIVLSYQDCPLVKEKYSDWIRHEVEVTYHSRPSPRGEKKPVETELLLTNFQRQPLLFD